jgi:hypothetical protein
VRLFRRRRYFYDRFTFDEFSQWSYDMFRIGLSVSAWQGDYGKAECLNCRSVVSIGVPSMTGLEYGKQHREVCGDRNLPDVVRRGLPEALSRIGE